MLLSQRAVQSIASPALVQREVEFTRAAWLAGLRPDQRKPQQLREVKVEFPLLSQDLACVHCGGTIVTASVSCALVEPMPQRPRHGLLDFSVRQPLTEREGAGRPGELRQLASFLERLVGGGGVLDAESLCVLPGRRAWSLRVDVLILNDEGNTRDCCVWATLAALRHYRRPELTVRGETIIVHPPHERDPVPLSLHHTPLTFTFAVTMTQAEREKHTEASLDVVVDPTRVEEAAAASVVVVAVNAEGQVCAVVKDAGCCIRLAELQHCIETATALAPQLLECIQEAMTASDARRQEAVKGQFLWARKRSGVSKEEVKEENNKKNRKEENEKEEEE